MMIFGININAMLVRIGHLHGRNFQFFEFCFSSVYAILGLIHDLPVKVVEETGVPGENHCLTSSPWQLSHIPRPGFKPRQMRDSVQSVAAPQTMRPSEQAC